MEGIVYGLVVAWFLALFGVDDICINTLQPFFTSIKLTTDHYYFVFGILGLITELIPIIKK